MSEELTLRVARPEDSRALAQVHIDTWRHTYAGMVPDQFLASMTLDDQTRSWRHWIKRGGKNERILLVETQSGGSVRQQGRIVGFGHAGPLRGRNPRHAGEVYTLYVDIDWQGRGIGRQLLGQLFGGLLDAGLESAVVWVLAKNPSRYFYEAMGGRRLAERQERFAGVMLDEVAYIWPDSAALRALGNTP